MKTFPRLLGAAGLFALASTAHADFYVGAGVYSTSLDAAVSVVTDDDTDFAPAVFLGWRPIELVGVEAGYYDLGSYGPVDASAMALSGLLSMELGPVGVYAKAGLAQTTVEAAGLSEESADPFGGLGLTVDLMDKLYVYGEYLRFTHEDADVDIDVAGVGLRYAF